MTSKPGERGQITIEKAIRVEPAIDAGDETVSGWRGLPGRRIPGAMIVAARVL